MVPSRPPLREGTLIYFGSHDSAIKMQAFIAFAARKFENYENNPYLCRRILSIGYIWNQKLEIE